GLVGTAGVGTAGVGTTGSGPGARASLPVGGTMANGAATFAPISDGTTVIGGVVVGGTSEGAVAAVEVARCQGKTAGAGKLGAICGGAVFSADRGGWMPGTTSAACTAACGTAPCGSPAINGLVP